MNFKKIIFLFSIFVFAISNAQIIKGKITNKQTNTPLAGVNVLVKGTSQGTVTDTEGEFEIDAKEGSTLIFSGSGIKTQEKVIKDYSFLSIEIGLGKNSNSSSEGGKVELAQAGEKPEHLGAQTTLFEKDFNKGLSLNANDLTVGRVAGLESTSRGGSPASSHVMRIRGIGSIGLSSSPLIVVDGMPLSEEPVLGTRNILNTINQDDIESITVYRDPIGANGSYSKASNGVVVIKTKKGQRQEGLRLGLSANMSMSQAGEYAKVPTADEFRSEVETKYPALLPNLGNTKTNWQKEIYKQSLTTNVLVHISDMVGKMPYRISTGHTISNGLLDTDKFKRGSVKANISPWFLDDKIRMDLNLSSGFIRNYFADNSAINSALQYDPTQSVRVPESKYGFHTYLGPSGNYDTNMPVNPVAILEKKSNYSAINTLVGNMKLDIDIVKNLVLSLNGGIDYGASFGRNIQMEGYPENPAGLKDGYHSKKTNYLGEGYFNYANNRESNHHIDLTAGFAYNSFDLKNDFRLENYAGGNVVEREEDVKNNIMSGIFKLRYAFGERYVLAGSFRMDGASQLAADNKWAMLPTGTFMWNAHNESFLKDSSVNEFRIRVGYGKAGNINQFTNYLTRNYGGFGVNEFDYAFGNMAFMNKVDNPEEMETLKWEISTTMNAGIDLGMWKDRLNISIDGYQKMTNDMIGIDPRSALNGGKFLLGNIGDVKSMGGEVEISGVPVQKEKFVWSISAGVGYSKSEISKLENPMDVGMTGGEYVQRHEQGQAPYSFYVYKQKIDAEGKPISGDFEDLDGDGNITENDRYFKESPFAPLTVSFGTEFKIYGFDLSVMGRGNFGGYVYSNGMPTQIGVYDANSRLSGKDLASDFYVKEATYIKLDNVTLGYTLPTERFKARIYVSGRNLFTMTSYEGLDPEVYGGIDYNLYLRPRIFTFGVDFRL